MLVPLSFSILPLPDPTPLPTPAPTAADTARLEPSTELGFPYSDSLGSCYYLHSAGVKLLRLGSPRSQSLR